MKYCACEKPKKCKDQLVIVNSGCCPRFPPIIGPTGPTGTGVTPAAAAVGAVGAIPDVVVGTPTLLALSSPIVVVPGAPVISAAGGGILLGATGTYELYGQAEIITDAVAAVVGIGPDAAATVLLEIVVSNGFGTTAVVEAEESINNVVLAGVITVVGGVTTFTPTFGFAAETLTLNASTLYTATTPNQLVQLRLTVTGTGTGFPDDFPDVSVDPLGTRLFAVKVA